MPSNLPSEDPELLWMPSEELRKTCQLTVFMAFLESHTGKVFGDYHALWRWSVDEPADFWSLLWDFTGVVGSRIDDVVLEDADRMPGAHWFPGARLNFAENLLRFRSSQTALIACDESGVRQTLDYNALFRQAAALASWLDQKGVGPGDRVAALVPNVPEAVVGMLATAWVGATWSSCSPDFGESGILERFGQIRPKVLIAADGYCFKGRVIDLREKVEAVWVGLQPHCDHCLLIGDRQTGPIDGVDLWDAAIRTSLPAPPFSRQPFGHPLYILFSSGTTGKPKCIIHGAGGTLLQHLKEHRLHLDLRPGDRLFYYTTCGWMMWNWLVSGLASGAAVVLFDGSPAYPADDSLWKLADDLGVTVFGTSAKFLSAQQKAGVSVAGRLPLEPLRTVLSTGSPLAPSSYDYVLEHIHPGVQICSISGGTDIVSCFALGCPLLPVRRGQLQCRGLGMAVEVFDSQGRSQLGEPGELVCTRPFPCMPVGFWNDPDGQAYRAAYFERFPGVWTHGDWSTLMPEGGLIIDGRSDTVLNPGGVRIGTAEIYRQVECIEEISESVCVGQQWDDDVRILLFVVLRPGLDLDDALRDRIRRQLRDNASPRHVPGRILAVNDIPRTRSGKISEQAVRDVIAGRSLKNVSALANPQSLTQFSDHPELRPA